MAHQQVQSILIRLAKIEEHVQATSNMIQTGHPYPDVLRQIAAMHSALSEVARLVVEEYAANSLLENTQREHLEAEVASFLEVLNLLI